MRATFAIVVVCLLGASSAQALDLPATATAADAETPAPANSRSVHRHAIGLSVARLFSGTFELGHEHTLTPRVSLVEILAAGTGHNTSTDVDLSRLGIGVQARWYALGDFDRGFILAADLRYEYRSSRYADSYVSLTGTGHGVGLGLWGGGKLLLSDHFFFEAGLGGAWNTTWAQVIWGAERKSKTNGEWVPLFVLGLGAGF